jgi:Uma2 family endonuclease
MTTTKLVTAEDLWRMPDDGYRYDLIKGELIRMTPPGEEHGQVSMDLGGSVWSFVRERDLGRVYAAETGFLLDEDPDVLMGPDVAFVAKGSLPVTRDRRKYLRVVPDLAVEIISPTDRLAAVRRKVAIYLEYGARLVWMVNPRRRTVTVFRPDRAEHLLTIKDELDGEDVLPGFRLPVAAIFE